MHARFASLYGYTCKLFSLYISACKFYFSVYYCMPVLFLFIVMMGLLLCILVHTSFASLYVCACVHASFVSLYISACKFCFSVYLCMRVLFLCIFVHASFASLY